MDLRGKTVSDPDSKSKALLKPVGSDMNLTKWFCFDPGHIDSDVCFIGYYLKNLIVFHIKCA